MGSESEKVRNPSESAKKDSDETSQPPLKKLTTVRFDLYKAGKRTFFTLAKADKKRAKG